MRKEVHVFPIFGSSLLFHAEGENYVLPHISTSIPVNLLDMAYTALDAYEAKGTVDNHIAVTVGTNEYCLMANIDQYNNSGLTPLTSQEIRDHIGGKIPKWIPDVMKKMGLIKL